MGFDLSAMDKFVSLAKEIASMAASAGVPVAGLIETGLDTEQAVEQAVVQAAPHNTALSAIGAGVTALAATPLVQSHPQAAALSSVVTEFFSWVEMQFGKLASAPPAKPVSTPAAPVA